MSHERLLREMRALFRKRTQKKTAERYIKIVCFGKSMLSRTTTIIENISFWLFFVLGFFGVLVLSIVVHEYVHYIDLKDAKAGLNISDERLCALSLPVEYKNWSYFSKQTIGFYSYIRNSNITTPEYVNYKKTTEIKAYVIGWSVFIFYIIGFLYIFYVRTFNKYKSFDLEIADIENTAYIENLENYIKRLREKKPHT